LVGGPWRGREVQPVLIVSVPFGDADYALIQIVPHTTQRRQSQFEVALPLRFLESGIFNVQGLTSVPASKFIRFLGDVTAEEMAQVEAAIKRWLALR
jgi:mRNA-degrading endonuclease toxin of MazEF toxin-antitoxin module